jgi:hypothetical protein
VPVEIAFPAEPVGLSVRPLRHGIKPTIVGSTARFTLDRPCKLSIESSNCPPLALFANPPEADPPQQGDPDVVWFGPGLSNQPEEELCLTSGQTLWLAPGAHVVRKQLTISGADRVAVRGPRVRSVALGSGHRQLILITDPLAPGAAVAVSLPELADVAGNRLPAGRSAPVAVRDGWDAARDHATLQGIGGWWYEMYCPRPVVLFSGTPFKAEKQHFLASWLPPPDHGRWFGHENELALAPGSMSLSANYEPVLTWHAPVDGTVRVEGTVASADAGLAARIRHHANLKDAPTTLWEGSPLGAHDCRVAMKAGEFLRFHLLRAQPAAGPAAAGGSATWSPRIRYAD